MSVTNVTDDPPDEGWARPRNAPKAHVFLRNEALSLGGRGLYTGGPFSHHDDSPDNCVACKGIRDHQVVMAVRT